MRAPLSPAGIAPSFGYIPGLDGLRAFAVLVVLVAHVGFGRWVPGGFGVTLFFFVSGMLITRLLLAERAATGGIAVGRFYARRMLRLYPALLVAVVLGAATIVAAGGAVPWGKAAAALFYVVNYYGIQVGWSQGFQGFDPMAVLWSLAIEEQYYIVFPLVALALAARPERFAAWVAAGLVAVPLWRCWLLVAGASSDRIYMGTDTRIDSILYGCLLTLLLAGPAGARWLRRLTRPAVVAVAAVALLATFLVRDAFFRDSFRYTVQGLALMALVAAVCFGTVPARLMRLLESRPARHVGRLSYSLYLLHPIAVSLAERAWVPAGAGGEGGTLEAAHLAAFVATAVPLSFLLAELSYRFVETPFLRWRRRFGSHPVEGRG